MSDHTKIEWADATINAINGCSVLSPGCTNCYAMRLAGTRMKHHPSRAGLTQDSKAGPVWTGEVRLSETQLLQPLLWKRPRRIFWNAHGDLFHEAVPDEWIDRVFAVCALTPQHTHMILTKRSARMREYVNARNQVRPDCPITSAAFWLAKPRGYRGAGGLCARPLPNVWLGVSVEDQTRADQRIPDLLATPAAVRFISAEPLLGQLDLTRVSIGESDFEPVRGAGLDGFKRIHFTINALAGVQSFGWRGLDWVIAGGESGPGARPMHPDWARNLRDQCATAGVPFHFKQWGEWAPVCAIDIDAMDEQLFLPAPKTHPEASRRCRVDQMIMHASGRKFPMDERSRISGDDSAAGDFAMAGGVGAMTMMRVGKARAGRLLDGVEHNGFPS